MTNNTYNKIKIMNMKNKIMIKIMDMNKEIMAYMKRWDKIWKESAVLQLQLLPIRLSEETKNKKVTQCPARDSESVSAV